MSICNWRCAILVLTIKISSGIFQSLYKFGGLPKRPTGADCKSAGLCLRWFESATPHQNLQQFPPQDTAGVPCPHYKTPTYHFLSIYHRFEFIQNSLDLGLPFSYLVNSRKIIFGNTDPFCRKGLFFIHSRAGIAQLARASAFQAEGRGFESRFPLQNLKWGFPNAHVAQTVEHFLGKEEVTGSSPVVGSIVFG